MLYKYKCGCVGLFPNEKGRALIMKSCDDDNGTPYGFAFVDQSEESFEPLSDSETKSVVGELNKLIQQGYMLREVRSILVY